MTPKEAIDHLDLIVDNPLYTDYFQDVCRTAIEALEKQIPKKSKMIEEYPLTSMYDYWGYECPCCGNSLIDYPDHHCKCGQAIDWSGEE